MAKILVVEPPKCIASIISGQTNNINCVNTNFYISIQAIKYLIGYYATENEWIERPEANQKK